MLTMIVVIMKVIVLRFCVALKISVAFILCNITFNREKFITKM